MWCINMMQSKKAEPLELKAFIVVHFIKAGETLCCYIEDFNLSLQLLAIYT